VIFVDTGALFAYVIPEVRPMAREIGPIPFEEFANNVAGFFERIIREHETVLVENGEGEIVVVKPASELRGSLRRVAPPRARRVAPRKKTKADREAFLSTAGAWKDLVDTDKLVEDIYESRRIPSRPPVKL
jgi:hypothetical protein